MRLRAVLVVVALSGCATVSVPPAPDPQIPSSTAWKMIPGSWAEYRRSEVTAVFDPASGRVTLEPGEVPLETSRMTNMAHLAGVARAWSPEGVDAVSVDPQLNGALLEASNGFFIGESGNAGARSQWPPEPLLTVNPIQGESFNVTSEIIRWDGTTFPFKTRYWTVEVSPGEVITTLIENPDDMDKRFVYQQTFDGELKEMIWGPLSSNNTVEGWISRRVKTGP